MRSATFTLLAAALASVCAPAIAADCPAVPVASPLPAKFSLSYHPLKAGPLPATGGNVVNGEFYDTSPTANQTSTRDKPLLIFQSNSTYAFASAFVDRRKWAGDLFLAVGFRNEGRNVVLSETASLGFPALSDGLGVVNGALVWDAGKGPQSLWGMCDDSREFVLAWGNTEARCVPVDLKVHVL